MVTGCRIGKVTWKSARLFTLPGVERRDIGMTVPTEAVLSAAIDNGLLEVALVGMDRGGKLYVAASVPDMDHAVGMFMRGVDYIVDARRAPLTGQRLDEEK